MALFNYSAGSASFQISRGLTLFKQLEYTEIMNSEASKLIDELGGNQPVAELLGVGVSAISNYRKTGFPAWTHTRLMLECGERGIEANHALFIAPKPERKAREAANG